MYANILSNRCISMLGATLRSSSILLLTCLAIGATSTANAVPSPPAGYDPDTGVSYFTPSDEVLGFELFDLLEPATSLGFFYESDPATLMTLFDSADPVSGGAQVTYINFLTGMIYDVDSGIVTPESFFTTMPEDIGFFLSIGSTTLYSDPLLNGGLDLFSAFPSMTEAGKWAFVYEGIDPTGGLIPINLTLVSGITSAPEPSIVLLVALGGTLMLVASRRRRKL